MLDGDRLMVNGRLRRLIDHINGWQMHRIKTIDRNSLKLNKHYTVYCSSMDKGMDGGKGYRMG